MAKIDLTKIEGYSEMTPEQKIAALEAYETADPDYTGYVKKDLFDKTSSELASAKKQLKDKMTEDEAAKAQEAEARAKLQSDYEALLHKTAVSENKAKLVALGYDEALADDTAEAMVTGDMDKVMGNQKKYLAAYEKKVRAEALKDTPKPQGGSTGAAMTLKTLRDMSPKDRCEYSVKNPTEYKALYTDTAAGDSGGE